MHSWKPDLLDVSGCSLEFIASPKAWLKRAPVLINSEGVQGYIYKRRKLDIVKLELLAIQSPKTLKWNTEGAHGVKQANALDTNDPTRMHVRLKLFPNPGKSVVWRRSVKGPSQPFPCLGASVTS